MHYVLRVMQNANYPLIYTKHFSRNIFIGCIRQEMVLKFGILMIHITQLCALFVHPSTCHKSQLKFGMRGLWISQRLALDYFSEIESVSVEIFIYDNGIKIWVWSLPCFCGKLSFCLFSKEVNVFNMCSVIICRTFMRSLHGIQDASESRSSNIERTI